MGRVFVPQSGPHEEIVLLDQGLGRCEPRDIVDGEEREEYHGYLPPGVHGGGETPFPYRHRVVRVRVVPPNICHQEEVKTNAPSVSSYVDSGEGG